MESQSRNKPVRHTGEMLIAEMSGIWVSYRQKEVNICHAAF